MKIMEHIKHTLRTWLDIQDNPQKIVIRQYEDFELHAIRNRIWLRGDSDEIEQLYQQVYRQADKFKFWACRSTSGLEMRKIHTGIPSLIVRTLTAVTLADMGEFDFDNDVAKDVWNEIEKENRFGKKLKRALNDALVIGDGAFKVTIDTTISEYPILEWYAGDKVEFIRERDRVKEIIFKTPYKIKNQYYVLYEHYGYGYIDYHLYRNEQEVDLSALEETAGISAWKFDADVILAVPLMIYDSSKYEGRGGSIYDGKSDSFDALDEAWSQWMDALRSGRSKEYIPECLIPRDPETGALMRPNAFDNRYIQTDSDMSQNASNQITIQQPVIPHDSYAATYITALDMALQGIISPSTLGIDVKKLDNAEAQREKEKTTLYTRNAIIGTLQETLPELIQVTLKAYGLLTFQPFVEFNVDIPFGEYANPSFESQVETVGKGKTQGIMSIEACVEELYGNSRNDDWKAEEVQRLKNEQGITSLDEPAVNLDWEGTSEEESTEEPPEGSVNE